MSSKPEEFSNVQINDETQNKFISKMDYNKNNSNSISVNSQITNDNSRNNSVKNLIKNQTSKMQRFITSTSFLSNKTILYFKNKFFPDEDSSDFDLLIFTKKNENTENGENKGNKDENKENKIKINENKIKENSKKNVNNIKNDDVNKNNSSKTYVNKNIQKNINKKPEKKNNYAQTYCRSDFNDKPPKVSTLFMDIYDYENKNIFSHSNDTCGIIKESKKIPNIFYDHLLVNNENDKRYITTSFNKNKRGKVSTFVYFAPRNNFA